MKKRISLIFTDSFRVLCEVRFFMVKSLSTIKLPFGYQSQKLGR